MSGQYQNSAYAVAVEVYGEFLQECVIKKVGDDRVGEPSKTTSSKIDRRPVRLVTISGKGGWSSDPKKAEIRARFTNVSLLDHCLSVARGALMFYTIQASDDVGIGDSWEEIQRRAYALVCIAFLHDIDKDFQLERGASIPSSLVAERMDRYGIDSFLSSKGVSISAAAMLNYIEEVEGTQAARSPAAIDYDRKIAEMSRYVEVADKLDGLFLDQDSGVEKLISSLENYNHWPVLRNENLRRWEVIQIYDHLRTFLLDHFQEAISLACKKKSGCLPLIEIVHDGVLLCVIPQAQSREIREEATENFIENLPFQLRFAINNRLACEFVGGAVTWDSCRSLMGDTGKWDKFRNLFALPREFASHHIDEINGLCERAEFTTSWIGLDEGAIGATVKPFWDHPEGSGECFSMDSVHALAFLTIALNHKDKTGRKSAPGADKRERELLCQMKAFGKAPPEFIKQGLSGDGRARRVLLAVWVVGEIWELSLQDENNAQRLFDQIIGRHGLVGIWLEGDSTRKGIRDQVIDNSSEIRSALKQHFEGVLSGKAVQQYDSEESTKHCFLCNVPTSSSRKVNTSLAVHGVKASAFSGRDGRNDHLASSSGDTHLCLVCQAELKLRQMAQKRYKGGNDLPPLVSSPVTMGLFGGLVYEEERDYYLSMGLNDLGRLDIKKGQVYRGLDVQTQRIRIARLESLPRRDVELVIKLRRILRAIQRLGRPIHLFRGSPRPHPAIFFSDTLPYWLENALGGDSLRIEQIEPAISNLEFFENVLNSPGLGTRWAKQIVDLDADIKLGALCVVWANAFDRSGNATNQSKSNWTGIENEARLRALKLIKKDTNNMKLWDNNDPLIRLACLATRVQMRFGSNASISEQLLCWNTALEFLSGSQETITNDEVALILGLAGTLEDNLTRGSSKAAAKEHRGGNSLQGACIEFSTHFVTHIWAAIFKSKEPVSKDRRKASAIYRFALLEAFREREVIKPKNGDSGTDRS